MNPMEQIKRNIRLDQLAMYMMEANSNDEEDLHTAQELIDSSYYALEAALEGVERAQVLKILEAAVLYATVLETAAFAYGMKSGVLLLRNLFSQEEPLF